MFVARYICRDLAAVFAFAFCTLLRRVVGSSSLNWVFKYNFKVLKLVMIFRGFRFIFFKLYFVKWLPCCGGAVTSVKCFGIVCGCSMVLDF